MKVKKLKHLKQDSKKEIKIFMKKDLEFCGVDFEEFSFERDLKKIDQFVTRNYKDSEFIADQTSIQNHLDIYCPETKRFYHQVI